MSSSLVGKCDNTQPLKDKFLVANKGTKSPLDANMLYEMFLNMKQNEADSYIDIYDAVSATTGRSEIIDRFISNLEGPWLRYGDLPEIYRVVRLYDYLTTQSSYVKNLTSLKLLELLEEIRELLVADLESEILGQIPGLMVLLNNVIIHPPTIYDFFLFYSSIITLSKQEKKDIKFLCLMLLNNPDVYKYSSSIIALSLMDIIMSSRHDQDNNIIYQTLDEYCIYPTSIYRNCLVDMLIFFTPTTTGHFLDKHFTEKNIPLTLMQICRQIKTCINLVPAKSSINTKFSHGTQNILSVNDDILIYDTPPRLGCIISNGGYGQVYRLEDNEKLVMKSFFDEGSLVEFIKVTNLNHNSVSRVSAICSSESDILFYNRAPFDLQKYVICIEAPMDKKLIRSYMKQLITAVAYCHSNMIAHLDIKPGNIVLHKGGELGLIDFGSSCRFNPFIKDESSDVTTHLYSSPEKLLGCWRYYSHIATDIWSVGCCMAFMLSKGQMKFFQPIVPNVSLTDDDIINNINDLCLHSSWEDIIPDISPLEQDFLSCLLKYDPHERMNALQALSHPYLN